uniref:YqaJ viral recombinase domain-containing protein n=1 Tax=uncultured marine virus TaxID=186617 RepID=A0A0F7L4Y1_9VIRU|nr:hypothetical protein [uncultured marine virus]
MSASKYINHGKLGGTAACILAHGTHFGNTPMSLWEELTKRKEPEDLLWKLPVQIGIATEQVNIDFLGHKTGYEVFPGDYFPADLLTDYKDFHMTLEQSAAGKVPLFTSRKFEWAVAQVDGFCRKPGEQSVRLAEGKHSSGFGTIEKSYETYYPQIQHYLGILGMTHGALTVIFDNHKHEFMWIRRDDKYIAALWKKMDRFWQFVQKDKPPVKVEGMAKKVVPVSQKDLSKSNSFCSAESDYVENENAAELFETAKKTLKKLAPADAMRTFGKQLEVRRAKNGNATIKPLTAPE